MIETRHFIRTKHGGNRLYVFYMQHYYTLNLCPPTTFNAKKKKIKNGIIEPWPSQ